MVDTQGFVLKAYVHAADESDNVGGQALLEQLGTAFPRLEHLWTDSGYKRTFEKWVTATLGWTVECVKTPWHNWKRGVWCLPGQEPPTIPAGFHVLPRRWVVERTFAWLSFQRRLSKEYELLPDTSEAWIYLASARLLWKRLAKLRC